MIGDAPGDMKAAKAVGARFYPIIPGSEERCWEQLLEEALDLFFAGEYAGDYESNRIEQFNKFLPDTPPWKKL